MSERTTHSKLAVAATTLPIAAWLYLVLSALIFSWASFHVDAEPEFLTAADKILAELQNL